MAIHSDTIQMDIDYVESPLSPSKSVSAKSDSSTISYTDDFETLPSSGPTSHAHIIDLGDYACSEEQGALKLQDAVVTTLFKASPATLKSFMNPTVNTFKAVFGKKDVQLVIWRKGLEVFVGTFEHHTLMKAYRFERVAGFLIGYDGSWHLKATTSNAYSAAKWSDVWAGKFECHGGVSKMTVEFGEVEMAKNASALAVAMIGGNYWELKTDIKTA
ncbi:hypothetical protein CFE70_009850 [Pyrenophora teres f. teres 0-1]|uniref:Uncharacterized protein n=2 Tax=Pyrenophora teres f. teres TaxID=97479 RepID=E3S0N8_PYRTT|nr:hypothetical protein PTT_15642 [Pyrenophora teres f. teres 0-1]KAE8826938.1 hypothetical protein HRS9139_08110 [Pyrenophora teres f. teres]KAE8832456.1 hypothetical protein PTNB85_06848 [Pyrenophora teres f. teres]KAE8836936.1 hypothetical protein HRS9122_07091 [Pyrenophora teres f. teres]KAE8856118.1 hypothetical protein PTNB29_08957 [Pyrenophora teres f. teres]